MKKMEKMKDFLYDLTATAEVSYDHLEDWFDEKSSVTNTLLKLESNGDRLMQFIAEKKKDEKFIANEMIKFFRDAYLKTEEVLVNSPELKDMTNGMLQLAIYSLWEIKKTALLAILICGCKIASPEEETVNKK